MTREVDFVDINKYAQVRELCDEIVKADKLIRRVATMLPFNPFGYEQYSDEKWKVSPIRYGYVDVNPLIKCLYTPLVRSAYFSKLEPGAIIKRHKGHPGDVFRLHYGIDIPEGDCAFCVGDRIKKWRSGQFLMFNDLDEHEAWNKTDQPRLILLVDIVKSFITDIDEADLIDW